eukprot:Pgem_evm9s2062
MSNSSYSRDSISKRYLKIPLPGGQLIQRFRVEFPFIEIPSKGSSFIYLQKFFYNNTNMVPAIPSRFNIFLDGIGMTEQISGIFNRTYGYLIADITPQYLQNAGGLPTGFDQTYFGDPVLTYERQLEDNVNISALQITITNENFEPVTFQNGIELVLAITTDFNQELESYPTLMRKYMDLKLQEKK